jgi:hypothetical protein
MNSLNIIIKQTKNSKINIFIIFFFFFASHHSSDELTGPVRQPAQLDRQPARQPASWATIKPAK